MSLRTAGTTLLVIALGLIQPAGPVMSAEPAKLGIGLGLTGPMAFLSQEYLKGLKAAVEVTNQEGGVGGGRKLELVVRDHKGVPSEAVAVAKRFIEQDRVDVVDIDLPSTVAIAAEAVTKPRRGARRSCSPTTTSASRPTSRPSC